MRTTFAAAVLTLTITGRARAADVTFPFDDARLLRDGETRGGLVHVAAGAAVDAGPVPLIVFLHGVNESGPLHFGLGAGPFDVRAIVARLVSEGAIEAPLVAGPSQTRDAWSGARLWSDFDLAAFVDAAETASGAKVDRGRVILAGFSGAGCNPNGGLLANSTKLKPLALVALDTCMDDRFGKLWAAAANRTAVHIAYQDLIWPREYAAFKSAVDASLAPGRTLSITKHNQPTANPHEEVVQLGLRSLLPALLPPPPQDDALDDI